MKAANTCSLAKLKNELVLVFFKHRELTEIRNENFTLDCSKSRYIRHAVFTVMKGVTALKFLVSIPHYLLEAYEKVSF